MPGLESQQQCRRTLREQVAVNESAGYAPLRARLAVMDAISVRAAGELEHIWRTCPPGRLRERRQAGSVGFWREFWVLLREALETGGEAAALELFERALDRLEPRA